MTPDDTTRVLRTLRGDLLAARVEARSSGHPWDWDTYLSVLSAVDQRIWNISVAADFHDRATRSEP